jgi:hypothetical protein
VQGAAEALGRAHDIGHGHAPGHQPLADRVDAVLEEAPERRGGRLPCIRDAHELQVAAAERHDPVVRAHALVPATPNGHEPVFGLQPCRGGIGIGGGEDDVVDRHRDIVLAAP